MHVLIQGEFTQAFTMMKFSVNHPWKFRNPELAFCTGFLQMLISFMIEVSNIYIVLANGETQFDIIANFIIMLVIADFDTYFYNVRMRDHITAVLTEGHYSSIFTWEVTTSSDANAVLKENELKEEIILLNHEKDQRPRHIHLPFSKRSCSNKLLYITYKVFYIFYTAIYYYFTPFIASYVIWAILIKTSETEAQSEYDNDHDTGDIAI